MHFFEYPSVRISIGLSLGILISFYVTIEFSLIVSLFFVTFISLVITHLRKPINPYPFAIIFALVSIIMGMYLLSIHLPINRPNHYSHFVNDTSQIIKLKITNEEKPTPFSYRYEAEVLQINDQGVEGETILQVPKDLKLDSLRADHLVLIYGQFKPLPKPKNQHQFDYSDYLKKRNIPFEITLTQKPFQVQEGKLSLLGFSQNIRTSLLALIDQRPEFNPNEKDIIGALFLGKRSGVDTELIENYQNAGAIHLLAVSGLHVGVIAGLMLWFFGLFAKTKTLRWVKPFLVIITLWLYAFITGLSPSVCRAALMFSFFLLTNTLNRTNTSFNTLAWAFAFLLLWNPFLLFSVGFQLSFAAVLSIIWIFPLLDKWYCPKNIIAQRITQAFWLGIAAQLGVAPLSIYYFHQFPSLFFVANVLVIPCLTFIYVLGLACLTTLQIGFPIPWLLHLFNDTIGLMNYLIQTVASFESFVIKNIALDQVSTLLCYLAIIFAVAYYAYRKSYWLYALLSAGIIWFTKDTIEMVRYKPQLTIAHQYQNSVLIEQNNRSLIVKSSDTLRASKISRDYEQGLGLSNTQFQDLQTAYSYRGQSILILNRKSVLGVPPLKTDILLLTQSPKINLERILLKTRPKQVVADGSNHSYLVKLWEQTCLSLNIPLHNTAEKGAFIITP